MLNMHIILFCHWGDVLHWFNLKDQWDQWLVVSIGGYEIPFRIIQVHSLNLPHCVSLFSYVSDTRDSVGHNQCQKNTIGQTKYLSPEIAWILPIKLAVYALKCSLRHIFVHTLELIDVDKNTNLVSLLWIQSNVCITPSLLVSCNKSTSVTASNCHYSFNCICTIKL